MLLLVFGLLVIRGKTQEGEFIVTDNLYLDINYGPQETLIEDYIDALCTYS
jgi:hypothetical protein